MVLAFAIAGAGAMVPPSPTPLTPVLVAGLGSSRWISSTGGTSVAVGTM
jgi:hypothetical protein